MEFYNMEQLSKMTDEEKDKILDTARQDLDNGVWEPARTVLRALSDMGSGSAAYTLLNYLIGAYGNGCDIPAAKALLNDAGQRLDPADRAYLSGRIAHAEFERLVQERESTTYVDVYSGPQFSALRAAFARAVADLYETKDAEGINILFGLPQFSNLLVCGGYNLNWGLIAQVCSWLIQDAPEGIGFNPNSMLTNTLKTTASQAALHPYLSDGSAVFTNLVFSRSGWFDNYSFEEFAQSLNTAWMIEYNKDLRQHFFTQYRLATTLPLSGIYAQLLQEIGRHLSYFPDFEGYDPNVFPQKKLFGNPPPAGQWATYLNEVSQYE